MKNGGKRKGGEETKKKRKANIKEGRGGVEKNPDPALSSFPSPLTSSRRTLQHLHYAPLRAGAGVGSVARHSTYNHIYNLPVRSQPQHAEMKVPSAPPAEGKHHTRTRTHTYTL